MKVQVSPNLCFSRDSYLARYMTFGSFKILIESSKLWLTNLGHYEEKYQEAVFTKDEECNIRRESKFYFPDNANNEYRSKMAHLNILKYGVFINCWRKSDFESKIMWREFVSDGAGVLILTKLQTLVNILMESPDERNCSIELAKYVNSRTNNMLVVNTKELASRKPKKFSHENEIRIMLSDYNFFRNQNQRGTEIRIDVQKLIRKIIISPEADSDVRNKIYKLAMENGLADKVCESKYTKPRAMISFGKYN